MKVNIASDRGHEFLLNAWYLAAWNHEVGEGLFARTIADQPLILFRDDDGRAVAMQDMCPHRFAPLSAGKLVDGLVHCGYHGLRFNGQGQCVHNPYSSTIPKRAQVPVYPVEERHAGWWVWLGAPELADPGQIPDFSFTGNEGVGLGVIQIDANYELVIDNLMDLSHIEYVHGGSFGGQGIVQQGEFSVEQEGRQVVSRWWMPGINPPDWAEFFDKDTKVDHFLDMYWHAPSSLRLNIGLGVAGIGRELMMQIPTAHILTPRSAGSTHYFHTYPDFPDRENLTMIAFEQEDRPMLESVQRRMGDRDFWDMEPAILHVDAGAMRARRVLRDLITAERTAANK